MAIGRDVPFRVDRLPSLSEFLAGVARDDAGSGSLRPDMQEVVALVATDTPGAFPAPMIRGAVVVFRLNRNRTS